MKGFTLIELMVAVVIGTMLIAGGALSLNASRGRGKIAACKNQLVVELRTARSYAKSLQMPSGAGGTLNYVTVNISEGGRVTARANGTDEYFSRDVSPEGISLAVDNNDFQFAAYSGRLNQDGAVITISSSEVGETAIVEINSLCLVNENR